MDKFISLYGSDKAFRDDYERRILPSLDMRQLSRDGRMRNPDEKPVVMVQQPPTQSEAEAVEKPNSKQPKLDLETSTRQRKDSDDEVTVPEQRNIKDPTKREEVDEVKLKELKREEEMAKAKKALERKKKLAEKAAAKAAIRAQKEAEKKLKEITIHIIRFYIRNVIWTCKLMFRILFMTGS